jgi:polyisoprenoid-binding protein YceI
MSLLLLALLAVQEETWYLDHGPKFTNIAFEGHAEAETIIGMTNRVAGRVTASGVRVSIPVASLRTGIGDRDEHLLGAVWFDAEKHPEITFVSKKVRKLEKEPNKVEVTGDFTLRGVAREMTVVVEMRPIPADAVKKAGFPEGRWIRFTAEFAVKLSDHGLKVPDRAVVKVADTWTVRMVLYGCSEPAKSK